MYASKNWCDRERVKKLGILRQSKPGSSSRCYTDASICPDTSPQVPRRAGTGIFIVTSYAGIISTIYVKAICQECNSVLMAEATTLALGAKILNAMQGPQPFFLSHNQQLVNFLNGKDHSNPPTWEIKPYTQSFVNIISTNGGKIFKIARKLNITAHVLANQAYNCSITQIHDHRATCTNPTHSDSCQYLTAINFVMGDSFTLVTASCR